MPVSLALSLHAPNDGLRSQLMPVNDRYPLAEVLAACERYREPPPPQGLRRVRDAGRRQRPPRARPRARGAARSARLQGQPDPLQPDRRLRRLLAGADRALPGDPRRAPPRPPPSASPAAATSPPPAASSPPRLASQPARMLGRWPASRIAALADGRPRRCRVAARRRRSQNPLRRLAGDLAAEWRGRGKFPPGTSTSASRRTHQIATDPLPILLCAYEGYGPIFTLRLLHTRVVFMLGPEANHFVTVSHPENFHWRESSFGDLIPLLGDGLLTIDDDYHDQARATMMPAFHREQVAAAVEAMAVEAEPVIDAPAARRGGRHLRVDAQPGDADRDARAARARSRRGRQGRRRRRALRARARASTGSSSPPACSAARARRGGR